jgi:hypothetical protein
MPRSTLNAQRSRTSPSARPSRALACARAAIVATLLAAASQPAFAQVITQGSGVNAAAIQTQVDAFRTSLGTLNANVAGSFGAGRREINWDGVPDVFSAPNALPANFFNSNSPRGVQFSTPGTGFQVSSTTASGVPVNFGNIDPSYATSFTTFSAQRLFTAIGSNILDVNFFVPGSLTPALTRGFGAVFTDVDLANSTSMEFFGATNNSLGSWFAPAGPAGVGSSLSFLGVSFAGSIVSRVRITSGNVALAAGAFDQNGNPRDAVAMDDFIYAEPVATVPEPATFLMLAGGLAMLAAARRSRRGA